MNALIRLVLHFRVAGTLLPRSAKAMEYLPLDSCLQMLRLMWLQSVGMMVIATLMVWAALTFSFSPSPPLVFFFFFFAFSLLASFASSAIFFFIASTSSLCIHSAVERVTVLRSFLKSLLTEKLGAFRALMIACSSALRTVSCVGEELVKSLRTRTQ